MGVGVGVTRDGPRGSVFPRGENFPDHPLYFWGAFEKCPKFDPTLGGRGSPNYWGIPLQTLTAQWRYLPDRTQLERYGCGPPYSLKICPICPCSFRPKKNFS